ncbi:hypothetical protein ACOMHN_016455 [Nucella lapillus]
MGVNPDRKSCSRILHKGHCHANNSNLFMRMAPSTMRKTKQQWPSVPSSSETTAHGSGQTGKGAEGAKNLWVRTGYRKRKMTAKPINIAAWNVRTLLDRKEAKRPERRMALVTRELQRYKIDIAALSETRFLDQGQRSFLPTAG